MHIKELMIDSSRQAEHMRVSLLWITLVAVGCHGATPQPESARTSRALAWDSVTAYRICESPDSVVAGKKECVLRDQSRPRDPQRFRPPPKP